MSALWLPSVPFGQLLLRGAVVYLAVLLLLRLAGKRQIGQMGAGEFAALLLISNSVQNAMNGGDESLAGGLILASLLIVLSVGISWLTFKSKRLEAWIEGRPTLLVHKGEPLRQNLDKERVSLHELKIMLRRQGIHELAEVHEAVLESNGWLSVVRRSELGPARQ